MVRGAAKAALLKRAAVFVQPSSHENFGTSVAEAMLFGKACIVNTGVALSRDIEASGAGMVFNQTVNALETALRQLLSHQNLRQQCEIAAKKLSELYSPQSIAKAFRREYEQCICMH